MILDVPDMTFLGVYGTKVSEEIGEMLPRRRTGATVKKHAATARLESIGTKDCQVVGSFSSSMPHRCCGNIVLGGHSGGGDMLPR